MSESWLLCRREAPSEARREGLVVEKLPPNRGEKCWFAEELSPKRGERGRSWRIGAVVVVSLKNRSSATPQR